MGRMAVLAVTTTLVATVAAAAAQPAPKRIFTPTARWTVNYDDDACRITRPFADGSDKAALILEQFEPGRGFQLLAATAEFKTFTGNYAHLYFGPGGYENDIEEVLDLSLQAYGPIVSAGMYLTRLRLKDGRFLDDVKDGVFTAEDPLADPTAEEENAITWLDVRRRGRAPLRFATGPMRGAMQALRKCSDDLITHWGIDVAAHQTRLSGPRPRSNPGHWLDSDDYPNDLWREGAQGLVVFRLMVDETGKPTSCHIQKSTRPEGFDRAVCDGLMKRASFDPALDASGKPLKSFWRSRVRFQMNR